MISKIDHIGIAVKSLEDSIKYYENALGFKCEGVEEVAEQKVKTAFFNVGGVHIELLEPTSEDSPIAKYLEKNPHGGVHHVAFNSGDIMADLAHAKEAGVALINETPKIGAHAKKIAFLHPKSTYGVLTEICQDGECACH
ncbi:MAG: methylmalonyl-CoA epimerase [Verrucomicrobiaceae bacterium]|jgi:methylmalonyl-CoA/ethylmalonyl-CoA epimerase|nr:methylmalonyl-CoA epimerase [Verrucomicrobiaceae bacterium]